jgi:ATP/maltotriose-dependent transcriptional regulator MalT
LNHPAQYTITYFEEANPFSEITPKWVKHFAHLSLRKVNSKGSPLVQLAFHTDLAAMCLNNQAIATRLSISEKTVRNHISNIFNKLQVVDRAQAIVRAREAGMGR